MVRGVQNESESFLHLISGYLTHYDEYWIAYRVIRLFHYYLYFCGE